MTPHPVLAGRARWLTSPSTVSVFAGIALATAYAWASLSFPVGTRLAFGVILLVVCVVFNTVGDFIEQRRLRVLAELGRGALAFTSEHLLRAALAVARALDVTLVLVSSFLVGGSFMVGVLWSAVTTAPASAGLRLAVIGLVTAPITSVIAYLSLFGRVRTVHAELVAAGLPAQQLYAALPARSWGGRLVVFALVAAVSPVLLIADLSLERFSGLAARVGNSEGSTARAAIDGAFAQDFGALGLLIAILLVLVCVSAWLAGTAIGGPLRALAQKTQQLAAGRYDGGFLSAEFESLDAAAALFTMEQHVLEALRQLDQTTASITTATAALVASATRGAERLDASAALAQTNATTTELARSASQIAANAQVVSSLAQQTFAAARSGKANADAFAGAMGQVREGNQAIADSVVRLNKRVQQVGRIVGFIDSIADRSDLLALNAELEGNKAGEVGRGFSLVAAEMRRLAESVLQSTREIAGLIEDIRDATNAAVMATEAGVKATDAGAALSGRVGTRLTSIVDFANQSSDAMQRISEATGQQQVGTEQLVSAMTDILRATRASADASGAMTLAHQELVELAEALTGALADFAETRR
jgi:methyl-accepting chemotaxis protein